MVSDFCSSESRIILLEIRGSHQNDLREVEYKSNVKEIQGSRDVIIIPRSCIFGMHSTSCKTIEAIINFHRDVRITNFCYSNGEIGRT